MKRFVSDIGIGENPRLPLRQIREMAMADGGKKFQSLLRSMVEKKLLSLAQLSDLKSLYRALADVHVQVVMSDGRAVSASAFPVLTGTLAIAMINEAYQNVPTIGEQLVEDFEDSKKVTSIAAVSALDNNVDEVKELQDFPEIGATEEKAEIRHKRNGRVLRVSKEMIEENELPDIINRINALGTIAATWVEEQTLSRIYDYYGSASSPTEPYVYRPNGTGTALYSATANTPGTRAPSGNTVNSNALVDETDLEAARVRLSTMKDNRGKRIVLPWSRVKLLCPDALIGRATKIMNSQMVPGVLNEYSNWGPGGRWNIAPERIVSSPKVDDITTTAWMLGDFQAQFKRKWKLRFEYITLGQDTESYLKSRVAFQARIAWDVEVGAIDYVFVVLNLTASTMPGG